MALYPWKGTIGKGISSVPRESFSYPCAPRMGVCPSPGVKDPSAPEGSRLEHSLHLEWQGCPRSHWWGSCLSPGAPLPWMVEGVGGLNVPTRMSVHPPSVWGVPSSLHLLPGVPTIQAGEEAGGERSRWGHLH